MLLERPNVRTRTTQILTVILALGIVVRIGLLLAWGNAPPVIVDAQDYQGLAARLAESGSYVDANGNLTSLRPPLFPAIVAQFYRVLGSDSYWAVRIFNILLSLATVVLVYQLGRQVYSPEVGIVAAAAYCFYPSLLGFNNLILSEVLFTFFATAGVLLSVRLLRAVTLLDAVGLGLCLGLGSLTRSVLWMFAPCLAIALVFGGRGPLPRRLLTAGVTLAVFAVTIAPWVYRNTRLQETFTVIDDMGGRNVMMGNYEYTPLERSWATIDLVTGERSWDRVVARQRAAEGQTGPLTQEQLDKAAMRYGVKFFFAHPALSLQRCVVKFGNFWQLERTLAAGARQGLFGEWSKPAWIALSAVVCGSYALTMFAAILAVWVTPPADWRTHVLLLLWIAFPCAIHTIAFAHSRYHLPLIPILLVYGAASLVGRDQLRQRIGSWQFYAACLLCTLLVAGWIRELVCVDLRWFS